MLFTTVFLHPQSGTLKAAAADDEVYTFGDFEYAESYGSLCITAYTGTSKSVSIPNTI